MTSPYDTPPDGDFARYVEQLGRQRPALEPAGSGPEAVATDGRRASPPPRTAATQTQPEAAARTTFAPARRLAQGAIVGYVAYVLLAAAFPVLAPWGVPLGLAYLAYAFLRLRQLPWRTLIIPSKP